MLITLPLVLAAAVSVEDADRKRLSEGEILLETVEQEGSDVPKIVLRGVVDAPPEQVWPVIVDCAAYRKFFPRIAESELLEQKGDTQRCRTLLDSPWPMKDLETYSRVKLTVEPGRRWVRSWTLEKGDFDRNDGAWTLTPFDGSGSRTLAVYEVTTRPHTSVPGFIRKAAQKSALPDVLEALRGEVKRRAGAKAAAP